jgi:hypothetical protein
LLALKRRRFENMKFEEYYYYFQTEYLKQLMMATVKDYVYFEKWKGWIPKPIKIRLSKA